jgi:DNA-binding GntR family transcriptional regulator
MNADPPNKKTLTDEIVARLTADIVAKRIAPGTALDEMTLGREFGASRTPVREALRQLAAGGLIELRPHRAPLVAAVDPAGLHEMFDVMAELEALCAGRAALAMSAEERRGLEMLHAAMAVSVRSADVAAYRRDNLAFHERIYDGARNGYLKRLALTTRERLAAYRGVQLQAPSRLAESYAEHGGIVTAILRGDRTGAAEAMRKHLTITSETVDDMTRPGIIA